MNWKKHPVAMLLGLLIIHVLAHIDRNLLSGFAPQITQELGLNNKQFGFLTGAVWVFSFGFMAIFMGTLADRFSRTRVMAFGVIVWSVCTAASGYAQSFEQMVAARFFVATGEAALVPAAVSLLAEMFTSQRRSTAVGTFFIGIPMGIGLAFVVAGAMGTSLGWRDTFLTLGLLGVMLTLPLLAFEDKRDHPAEHSAGVPLKQQVRLVVDALRGSKPLRQTIIGFVLVHFAFAGLAFVQLWLVRERGFDGSVIAKQMGTMQIVFGTLGAILGGLASDRFSKRFKGGHATVLTLMVLAFAPLMLVYRFAQPGSLLFFIGMCAGFILPLASYGPANALIQALTPIRMRSTITGATMMLINVFAIAIGNVAVGAVSDHMAAGGSNAGLTTTLVATDVLVALSIWFFWRAASSGNSHLADAPDKNVVLH